MTAMREESKRPANEPASGDMGACAGFRISQGFLLLLFVTINALLLFSGAINIKRSGTMTQIYVLRSAGIGLADVGLALAAASTLFLSYQSVRILRSRGLILIGLVFVAASVNGFLGHGMNRGAFTYDLRIYCWFYAGVISALLLWDSGRVRAGLVIIVTLGSVFMALAAYAAHQMGTDLYGRLTSWAMWTYSAYLYAPTALLIAMYFQQSRMARIVATAAVALHLYLIAYLGATKSTLVTLGAICFFGLLSAAVIRRPDGTTGLQFKTISGLALCTIALFSFVIVSSSLTTSWTISQRLSDGDDRRDSTQGRILEVQTMISQISATELWMGKGTGASFRFESQEDYVGSLHIGIFTFLPKFGLPVFVCLVFLAYVYLPWKYIQSVVGFGVQGPYERAAFLLAMPALFSWVAISSMSGGFEMWSFLGAGLTYATFQKLRHGQGARIGRPNLRGGW